MTLSAIKNMHTWNGMCATHIFVENTKDDLDLDK